jgi:hypothetical protein
MSVVNSNYAQSFVTNYTRPITFTPTTGNTLTIVVLRGGGGTVTGVTDNSSGTPSWDLDRTFTVDGQNCYIYRRANISGSPTNVNIAGTVDHWHFTWLLEDDALSASGQPAATGSEQHSSSFGTSHSADIDAVSADDLVLLFMRVRYNPQTITFPSGWTGVVTAGSLRNVVAYNTSDVGAAPTTAAFTLGGPDEAYFWPTYYARASGGGLASIAWITA